MLENLLAEVEAWGHQTFPASTDHAKLIHLREEIGELLAEPGSAEETADCVMILAHLLGANGTAALVRSLSRKGVGEIFTAIEAKLAICRQRTWGQPDEDGVVKAIKKAPSECRR